MRNGYWITNATAISSRGDNSASDTELTWLTTSLYTSPASTQYEAVLEAGDEFPQLATLGRKDLWSLCPFGDGPLSQRNLVFNMTGETGHGFNPDECWAVRVNIVGI